MFLKRSVRRKGGEKYESWSLVESVRTARGPRQRTVAMLGKLPGLDEEERIGWEEVVQSDLVLPHKRGRDIRLRLVSRPEHRLRILLHKLGLLLPNRPKNITECSGDF